MKLRFLSVIFLIGLAACQPAKPPGQAALQNPPTSMATQPSVTAVTAKTQLPLTEVPPQRLVHLSKSVNITRWFWYPEGSGADYFKSYITDDDLTLLRSMGVLSVRLVISPTFFYQVDKPTELNPAMIGYLDSAVDRLLAHDLAVVIDMHDQEKDLWEKNPAYVEGFLQFWPVLAKHFADRDVDRVIFELLNEPVFDRESERWAKLQARWVEAMRAVVPTHTFIVTGNEWGGINGLTKLSPLTDRNLIYSFHFYDPFQFTHQGATWAGPDVVELRDIPYPATPERCKPMLDKITDPAKKSMLRNYCYSYWTASKLKNKLSEAADWGKKNNVPLWMGEFGVFCPYSPTADRAQWIKDISVSAQSLNIGWAIWGYDECFGMQRKLKDGKIVLDNAVVQALGLKLP